MATYGDRLIYDQPDGFIGPVPDGAVAIFLDYDDESGWPRCEFEDRGIVAVDPATFDNFRAA